MQKGPDHMVRAFFVFHYHGSSSILAEPKFRAKAANAS